MSHDLDDEEYEATRKMFNKDSDIEILEEYTKHDTDLVNLPEYDAKTVYKAIENLINRVKELEEENKYLKEQIPVDKIFYYSYKDYIPKSKIKEKIADLRDAMIEAENLDNFYQKGYARQVLQDLLK